MLRIIRDALDRLNLDHLAYRTVEPPKQVVVYRLPHDLCLDVVIGYCGGRFDHLQQMTVAKRCKAMVGQEPEPGDPEYVLPEPPAPASPAAQSGLEIFDSPEFGPVRTVVEDGKPLFCARDVALALGYTNVSQAVGDHCRWVSKRYLPHPQSPSAQIEVSFIPESDVYRLVMRSKLPGAERFQDWVVEEVLPALRQTGRFEVAPAAPQTLSAALRLAADLAEQNEAQSQQLEEQKHKVEYYDDVVDAEGLIGIGAAAKSLRISLDGKTVLGEHKLYALLRADRILSRSQESHRFLRVFRTGIVPYSHKPPSPHRKRRSFSGSTPTLRYFLTAPERSERRLPGWLCLSDLIQIEVGLC